MITTRENDLKIYLSNCEAQMREEKKNQLLHFCFGGKWGVLFISISINIFC